MRKHNRFSLAILLFAKWEYDYTLILLNDFPMPLPWSNLEVELIVADYFSMLSAELKGEFYSKTTHRIALLPLLQNRTQGSIEFKHQNITAVLIRHGQPYISGYLPRYNYQKILEEKVLDYLSLNLTIEESFKKFVEKEIVPIQNTINYQDIIVEAPKVGIITEPFFHYKNSPVKINYLEREQRNQKLGLYGEAFVLEYERWSLINIGKENLADKIEWISRDVGDGAGFDILSKNPNGTDKYIEVKTTRLGKETPFFFSSNELDFSISKKTSYNLYRLFNVDIKAKIFIKNGALNEMCNSSPILFKGFF